MTQPDVRIVAICDVRQEHRDGAKQVADARNGDSATRNDFREWHALVGLEAARRGKDIYPGLT